MVKVAILGASGYIGGELIRLLIQHPKVELVNTISRRHHGEYLFRIHPNLRGLTNLKFDSADASRVAGSADFVFAAMPHGESLKEVATLADSGMKLVDLSADFRLRDSLMYPIWYGYEHPRPDLLSEFVLSVPELNRDEVRGARLVSSPGCMAITTILTIAPLIRASSLGVDRTRVVVDAKIGSSGAGGKPSVATHFSERYGVVRPYKPAGHRHVPEIEQVLSKFGGDLRVSMSAHAVNMVRGILSTCHLFTNAKLKPIDVWTAYRDLYARSFFIRLVREKRGPFRLPDPKLVVGSNFCDLGFEIEDRTDRVVAMGATDNLVKGAAGNAVQSMNLMLGFKEEEGLSNAPLHPV